MCCTSQVFSGTFRGQNTTEGNSTSNTPPSLQIEATAATSNLQVYTVNVSSLNLGGIQTFSDDFGGTNQSREEAQIAAFCRELLAENPSEDLSYPPQDLCTISCFV